MTWSTVQHTETLTPSSILIFQGALVGTGLRFLYIVPEGLFQKSFETLVFSSFATSLRNHMGPYGIPGYGSLGILGPDGIPGYGSLGILGPYGIPGGLPMGSQGMDPWGSWVPMGSQGMDPLNTTNYH